MPISTPHFALECFLEGDFFSAIADKRRSNTIDNQLYRVAETVGDGVIGGWEITSNGSLNTTVSAGSGLVEKFYINTFDNQSFSLLPNSQYNAYIQRRIGIIATHGPRSDIVSVSYADSGPPSAVNNFFANADGSFKIDLTWTVNTEQDLDIYKIERSIDGTNYIFIADIKGSNNVYSDITVDEDISYFYNQLSV